MHQWLHHLHTRDAVPPQNVCNAVIHLNRLNELDTPLTKKSACSHVWVIELGMEELGQWGPSLRPFGDGSGTLLSTTNKPSLINTSIGTTSASSISFRRLAANKKNKNIYQRLTFKTWHWMPHQHGKSISRINTTILVVWVKSIFVCVLFDQLQPWEHQCSIISVCNCRSELIIWRLHLHCAFPRVSYSITACYTVQSW